MSLPLRVRIYEFLSAPAFLWLIICAWLVGGDVVHTVDIDDESEGP